MDGVFVELGVHDTDHHAGHGLFRNGALLADFVEGLDDELTGLVEALNTLGVVDQHVGSVDGVDLAHQVLVHAKFSELVARGLGVLVTHGAVTEVTVTERFDDLCGKRLHLDEEAVVAVR